MAGTPSEVSFSSAATRHRLECHASFSIMLRELNTTNRFLAPGPFSAATMCPACETRDGGNRQVRDTAGDGLLLEYSAAKVGNGWVHRLVSIQTISGIPTPMERWAEAARSGSYAKYTGYVYTAAKMAASTHGPDI